MRPTLLLAVALLAVPALAACTENAAADDAGNDRRRGRRRARARPSSSSDTACDLSATEAPAGTSTFDVTNTGDQVTEFYLLGEDGLRIVGEVENIGPQLNRQLVVNAPAGTYVTACKPGMKGEGIRADFTVTEPTSDEAVAGQRRRPGADRRRRSRTTRPTSQDQSDQLLVKTQQFVERYKAGDDDAGPRASTRSRAPLGADRDRGGVLRRPRPDDGRPRGRPRAGPGVDRLAPDREGPVAARAPRTTRR